MSSSQQNNIYVASVKFHNNISSTGKAIVQNFSSNVSDNWYSVLQQY